MNDFDDELTAAVVGDGIDRTAPTPGSGEAMRAGRRRRARRRAALASATAVVGLAGLVAIGLLATGDTDDVIVSDTSPPPSTTLDQPQPAPTDPAPTSIESSTTLDLAAPPDTDAPVDTQPSSPTSGPPSTVLSPASTIKIDAQLTQGVATVDLDNQIEIRDGAGNPLWAYRYCEPSEECRAVVQTVTTDDAWVIVDRGDLSAGEIDSSELRRISLTDGAVSVESTAAAGSHFVAGQPTEAGLMLASSVNVEPSPRVSITGLEDDYERILDADVSTVEVSVDGRYLALTATNLPEDYGRTTLYVQDLLTGRSATSTIGLVTAEATAWSPDGTMLLIANTWEETEAFLIDPWSGQEAIDARLAERFDSDLHWEHACFVDDSTVAVATWNSPYSEESALPGTIVLLDAATGSVVGDLEVDAYGHGLVCHIDGTASFVSIPLVTETFGTDESEPYEVVRPDHEAPTEIVHAVGGGQLVVTAGDGARLDTIR